MPLKPLKFDSIANTKESIERLRLLGLVTVTKVNSHEKIKAHFAVTVSERLTNELLVSKLGETYLLSDVLSLSEQEAQNTNIEFASKDILETITIQNIRNGNAKYIIRNRPLADALNTVKFNHSLFTLTLKPTRLFPFPTIFPVITSDEKSEEEFKARSYNSWIVEAGRSKPYAYIHNHALEQLYVNATKTELQLGNYQLGLFDCYNSQIDKTCIAKAKALEIHLDQLRPEYEKAINDHPEFRNKKIADVNHFFEHYQNSMLASMNWHRLLLYIGLMMSISFPFIPPICMLAGKVALVGTIVLEFAAFSAFGFATWVEDKFGRRIANDTYDKIEKLKKTVSLIADYLLSIESLHEFNMTMSSLHDREAVIAAQVQRHGMKPVVTNLSITSACSSSMFKPNQEEAGVTVTPSLAPTSTPRR